MIFQSQQFFYRITAKSSHPLYGKCSRVILAAFVVFLFGACAKPTNPASRAPSKQLSTEAAKNYRPLQVNSIVVLPLQEAETHAEASAQLQELLIGALERRTSLEVLNRTEASRVQSEVARASSLAKSQREQAVELGRTVGAQGVVYGIVTSFEQMAGSRMGAERLARAGFRLWLVDPKNGQTLWTAAYDNQEQPLSDNLFRLGEKLKSGVGFRTAEELIKVGFDAAGDELETLRRTTANEKPVG